MSCPALPEEVWKRILQHIHVEERLRACSTVSTLLYRVAAAATREVHCPCWRPQWQCIQKWLVQHGQHVTRIQMDFQPPSCTWTQLPCQQLQELCMCRGSLQLAPSSSQPGVLQCCTGLTKLYLFDVKVLDGAAGLAALTRLPRLQDLELHAKHDSELLIPDTVLGALTGLKRLATSGAVDTRFFKPLGSLCDLQELYISLSSPLALVPEEIPDVTQLTSLHTLMFARGGTLDPALLHSCTNMQHLILERVSIRAGGNINALLELLGCMQELQHLELDQVSDWPPPSAAYTALAGGSKLQHLSLVECSLPADIWQMVLPGGRNLLQLTEFSVFRMPQPAMLSAGDVRSLAGCCSGLRCLMVELQPGVQLPDNLSSLSALTELHMLAVSPGAFLSSLVTLQSMENLSELYADFAEPLPPLHLVRLTCLRRLTVLELTYDDEEDDAFCLYQQDRTSTPNIWRQLL